MKVTAPFYMVIVSVMFALSCSGEFSGDNLIGGGEKRFAGSSSDDDNKNNGNSGAGLDDNIDADANGNGNGNGIDGNGNNSGSNYRGDYGEGNGVYGSDGAINPNICKYFDAARAGSAEVYVQLPAPMGTDPRVADGTVMPTAAIIAATGGEYAATAVFFTKGPNVDLTQYTLQNKGNWAGNSYRLAITGYKDPAHLATWGLDSYSGVRLAEAKYDVTIHNADSPNCTVSTQSIPMTRGEIYGDPTGCFDGKTKILMADGSERMIETIRVGDRVFNPILKKSFEVIETSIGPERELGMIEVSLGKHTVIVTSGHPFITANGMKTASALKAGDAIINSKGQFDKVTKKVIRQPDASQLVYNISLKASSNPLEHAVLADGVITGDLYLQRELAAKKPKQLQAKSTPTVLLQSL